MFFPGIVTDADDPPAYIEIENQCLLTSCPFIGPAEPPHKVIIATVKVQPVQGTVEAIVNKAKSMDGYHGGQCVAFIQRLLNSYYTNPEFRGRAGDIEPNATEPQIGGAVITSEGPVGHVALIIDMTEDYLIVAESNLNKNDEIIRVGRRIYKDREYIVGYFNF